MDNRIFRVRCVLCIVWTALMYSALDHAVSLKSSTFLQLLVS